MEERCYIRSIAFHPRIRSNAISMRVWDADSKEFKDTRVSRSNGCANPQSATGGKGFREEYTQCGQGDERWTGMLVERRE